MVYDFALRATVVRLENAPTQEGQMVVRRSFSREHPVPKRTLDDPLRGDELSVEICKLPYKACATSAEPPKELEQRWAKRCTRRLRAGHNPQDLVPYDGTLLRDVTFREGMHLQKDLT